MLDIPTARAARRPATAPAAQPAAQSESLMAGSTSLAPGAPTAQSQTAPYEYAGQGWNDPVAQSVMKDYFSGPQWNTGSAPGMYEQNMNIAQTYNDTPGVLHSSLDPASWGTTFRGQDYTDIAEKYKQAGGTYFNQFTPAQQAGVPYYAATGEPAPIMNMQTGVAETPTFGAMGQVTGQTPAMNIGGSGSYHAVDPAIISRMWR